MTAPPGPEPIHNITELDLVDAAVQTIRLRHPEWDAREGQTEVMLLEALAVIGGQTIYATNQLPPLLLAQILDLYGAGRLEAEPATARVKVTATSSLAGSQTLPAGARIRLRLDDGTTADLTTDGDLTIDPGSSLTGIVDCTADTDGAGINQLPTSTPTELVTPTTWIETVQLYTTPTGGRDEEPEQTWLTRGSAILRRLPSALTVTENFETAAPETTGVARAAAINLWDGASSNAGADLGNITIVAIDPSGQPLDGPTKTDMIGDLTSRALAGLTVHAIDPTYRDGTLTWSIIATPEADPTALAETIRQLVAARLDRTVWQFGADPNPFAIATAIGQLDEVLVVTECTWAFTDPAPDPKRQQLIGTVSFADQTVAQ